ncbi:MAG: hypothetical protein AABY33_08630 [Pseudomonadota bacterium]
MRKMSLFLIMVTVAMNASYNSANAADAEKSPSAKEIRRNFFEGCLSSANSLHKYTLYKKCIGKFASECMNNIEKYDDWLKDINMGSNTLNCIELESQWWAKIFDKHAKELRHKVHKKEKDKEITEALEDTLTVLKKRRLNNECTYGAVSNKEWNPARLFNQFSCDRDLLAESAITVYLLNTEEGDK